MSAWTSPPLLQGRHVQLEPLAFEDLGCVAVGHADGSLRDTVLYSIIDAEWPAVRSHLDARLAAHGAKGAGT